MAALALCFVALAPKARGSRELTNAIHQGVSNLARKVHLPAPLKISEVTTNAALTNFSGRLSFGNQSPVIVGVMPEHLFAKPLVFNSRNLLLGADGTEYHASHFLFPGERSGWGFQPFPDYVNRFRVATKVQNDPHLFERILRSLNASGHDVSREKLYLAMRTANVVLGKDRAFAIIVLPGGTKSLVAEVTPHQYLGLGHVVLHGLKVMEGMLNPKLLEANFELPFMTIPKRVEKRFKRSGRNGSPE